MKVINDVKIYTLREVSEMLGCGYATALSYARKGKLPAVRVGRSYQVTEVTLLRFLNGETQGTASAKDEPQTRKPE